MAKAEYVPSVEVPEDIQKIVNGVIDKVGPKVFKEAVTGAYSHVLSAEDEGLILARKQFAAATRKPGGGRKPKAE